MCVLLTASAQTEVGSGVVAEPRNSLLGQGTAGPGDLADDSLVVSLLTCSPGTEAYTLFGHTALYVARAADPRGGLVFNYGMFRYDSENFIYRFLKGETDYELGAEPVDAFMGRYLSRGFTVWEQTLAMTQEEKAALKDALEVNYRPENRMYRYSYLYDNCTTRALDVVRAALGHEAVAWAPNDSVMTYRDVLHRFTASAPWTGFGIDLILGSELDRETSGEQTFWIPQRLMAGMETAEVRPDGRRLVASTRTWKLDVGMDPAAGFPLSPMQVMWAVLAASVAVTLVDWKRRRLSCWLDVVLWLVQGIAGFLVAFLFFFSEHPAVGSNWLVIMLNPLALLLIPNEFFAGKGRGPLWRLGRWDVLQCVNVAGLLVILSLFVIPVQWFPPALLPLVLSLLLRGCIRLRRGAPQ
jgi:hypothetical protein